MAFIPQRSIKSATQPGSVKAPGITLGVEFEFLVLECYEIIQEPTREQLATAAYKLSLLKEPLSKPIQFTCSSCGEIHDYIPPSKAQKEQREGSNPKLWNVLGDDSMKLKFRQFVDLREDHCGVYGVELTSRALSKDDVKQTTQSISDDANHFHTITYQEEVSGILDALQKAFNTPPPVDGHHHSRRLLVNNTCALHVHVGNGLAGFTVQTVKNLLSIYTAFERVIDEMHATSRIGGSALALTPLNEFSDVGLNTNNMADSGRLFSDVFNMALTERFVSNAYVTRRNDNHTPELKAERKLYPDGLMDSDPVLKEVASRFDSEAFVDVIQKAPNIKSLREMLSDCSENSVSITHLIADDGDQIISDLRPYKRFNTIEFRQHAAVTDAKEALPWIDFVQALVTYANSQSVEKIMSDCKRAATDPRFDLKAMFELLHVGQETRQYYLGRSNESIQHSIEAVRMEIESFGAADPFRKISSDLLNERANGHDRDKVLKTIRDKFKEGGYGQFSRESIDVYAPLLDDESKDKLEIGREPPPKDEEAFTFDTTNPISDL
jgi:hypothetical protein